MSGVSRQDRHTGVRVRLLGLPSCLLEASLPTLDSVGGGSQGTFAPQHEAPRKKATHEAKRKVSKGRERRARGVIPFKKTFFIDLKKGPVLQSLSTQIHLSPKEQVCTEILMSLSENQSP